MLEDCQICEGSGYRVEERTDGTRFARPCSCRVDSRNARHLQAARIPRRYEHCTFESFETGFQGADKSLFKAKLLASNFVSKWPHENDGKGLLLTGSIGIGKTHLATSVLRDAVEHRGAKGLFYDYRDLLKQIQNSYSPTVRATEMEILQPVFDAEVLVLDELGAAKVTDWVWDTVAHILNTRYNDKRTTIITSNFANRPPLAAEISGARAAMRDDTLGDRIGERMRSRLQEMCVQIEMHGEDFRQSVKRARLA